METEPTYTSHQGDKSNLEWCLFQLHFLKKFLKEENTKVWLNKPNPQLGNDSPLGVIAITDGDKGFKIVGDLISDMLTGSPS